MKRHTIVLTAIFSTLLAVPFNAISDTTESPLKTTSAHEQIAFEKADTALWQTVFSDDGSGDWTTHWFLDGEIGTVTNTPRGMEMKSGMEYKNQAHHMVLWTKESFTGDVKIEFEFTRLDEKGVGVCILYIQATGSGDEGFDKDISKWNDFRKVPVMSKYFHNMNTYHISYATDYIRGRRYLPGAGGMNGKTELVPDYQIDPSELFEVGVPYQVTVIKQDREIFMMVSNDEKARYFHLINDKYDIITNGRIGLRQMYTRWSRYKDLKISVLK